MMNHKIKEKPSKHTIWGREGSVDDKEVGGGGDIHGDVKKDSL